MAYVTRLNRSGEYQKANLCQAPHYARKMASSQRAKTHPRATNSDRTGSLSVEAHNSREACAKDGMLNKWPTAV